VIDGAFASCDFGGGSAHAFADGGYFVVHDESGGVTSDSICFVVG